MEPLISVTQANRAIIIDFEGTKADPPSLLGVLYVKDGEMTQTFDQFVFETALFPAGDSTEVCTNQDLSTTLINLANLARSENRILIAWSSREIQAIREANLPSLVMDFLSDNVVDARVLARRWKRRFFPDVVFPYITGQGRHRLSEYMKLIGYPVPSAHGPGNTGQRIRYVRQQLLSKHGEYADITRVAKGKWTNLLKHNWHDCGGLREILVRVAIDLSDDGTDRSSAQQSQPAAPVSDGQTDLFRLGYSIRGDKNKRISRTERLAILENILNLGLLSLKDVVETIASHIRIRKNRSGGEQLFRYAIREWEYDLQELRKRFYADQSCDFAWPTTEAG